MAWRRVVFAGEGKGTGMIYIFGHMRRKREYVGKLSVYGSRFSTKQRIMQGALRCTAAGSKSEIDGRAGKVAEQLCRKEVVIATETGAVSCDRCAKGGKRSSGRLSICCKRGRKSSCWCGWESFDNVLDGVNRGGVAEMRGKYGAEDRNW